MKDQSVFFKFVDKLAASGDRTSQELLLPRRGSEQAAGFDLVAANETAITIAPGARALIPTGIAIALPNHWEAQVRPRSGLALKSGVTVLNSPGTIDADYRGEIGVILINLGTEDFVVTRGTRIAQLVIAQFVAPQFECVAELSQSNRGEGGFGSTGLQKEAAAPLF
jgi:dUTP pyrophosphatase